MQMTDQVGPQTAVASNAGTRPRPGWYPDPWTRGQHRYWNGESWTTHTFPDGPADPAGRDARAVPPAATWTTPSPAPPHPEWSRPDSDPAGPSPAPEPVSASPVGRRSLRLPQGRAFVALLLLVGLMAGFLSVAGAFFALGGRSKAKAPAAAPVV